MKVIQNVNIKKFEEFRTFLKENPEKARLKLEARAVYEGQVGRSTVHIGPYQLDDTSIDRETRHYTIPFGAWREVEELMGIEGPSDRMEPVEMALAATASCVVNSVTFNTVRLGINIEGLEISVRSTVDPRVLFDINGSEDYNSCIRSIEYDVNVQGDISDDELKTIKQLCEHSPVYIMMATPIAMTANVKRTQSKVEPGLN
ncbi:MAG: OsmC family protein [Flavobacteriaceae bacterium]|nr:OsmC family protein [Flavobacteriaceae bacterium]